MNRIFAFVAVAAMVAVPARLLLADAGTCAKEGAATCAAAKSEGCPATAGACCATSKGSSMTLRIKGSGDVIKASLAKLDGVTGVDTCSDSKLTKVAYSKDKVCSDKVFAALKTAGLKVEAQQVTFAVDGMSCEACSGKVSKALSKMKGVADAKVCHSSKKAVVEFDPTTVSADKVLAAIDATGFKATEAAN